MENLVSIITPTYNCEKYIKETVKSVLSQSYKNWELIVVDDYSTDTTVDILKKYQLEDSRIQLIQLESNKGAAVARSRAIDFAKGRFIAFLDSDDIWTPDKLSEQISYMIENNYAVSCTSYLIIDESGNLLNQKKKALQKVNYSKLLIENTIGNSSLIYDASKLGKFSVPNIRKRNDYALWLKILKKEKYIYGFDKYLMYYRVRKNSISSNKLSLIKYHWHLYHSIEKLSIIKSIYHLFVWMIIKIYKSKIKKG
ncbi:MAG: glycosyltransferase family 2 protein [Sphaerochaetaceae bacterium]|nr:glycosyltransferase family 2 protein [Sphaerochaetaceae bacterium]